MLKISLRLARNINNSIEFNISTLLHLNIDFLEELLKKSFLSIAILLVFCLQPLQAL